MSRSHNNKKTCRSHQGYSRESGVGNALGAQVGRFVFVRSAVDKMSIINGSPSANRSVPLRTS